MMKNSDLEKCMEDKGQGESSIINDMGANDNADLHMSMLKKDTSVTATAAMI